MKEAGEGASRSSFPARANNSLLLGRSPVAMMVESVNEGPISLLSRGQKRESMLVKRLKCVQSKTTLRVAVLLLRLLVGFSETIR
jgi:hypothetical protein